MMLLVFGFLANVSMSARLVFMYVYCHKALMLVQGSMFPLCSRESVPFAFCKLVLLRFAPGNLFP
jgi:hypothetical protein